MRLLSGCDKRTAGAGISLLYPVLCITLLIFSAALPASCGSKYVSDYINSRTVAGEVIVRGGGPMTRTVLIRDDYGLKTRVNDSSVCDELARLKGRRVRIRGKVKGSPRYGYSIDVESYRLVPPSGMIAVRGVVNVSQGNPCLIEKTSGSEVLFEGRLSDILIELTGYELWVWGKEEKSGSGDKIIRVEGYDLIAPAR